MPESRRSDLHVTFQEWIRESSVPWVSFNEACVRLKEVGRTVADARWHNVASVLACLLEALCKMVKRDRV